MLRRSVMTLYSGAVDIYSHQVRIVLAEKGVGVDVLSADANSPSEDLAELNPYNTLPTLVDRELVLYSSNVIMEYLDERFPHPPLLPVYPVARAKSRLMMYRIERDWYSLVRKIESDDEQVRVQAQQDLQDSLVALSPVFSETPFFLSEEFSLVDCVLAPLFWRLPTLGISMPEKKSKDLLAYAQRVFERDSFQVSLTEPERELRGDNDF